MSNNLKLTVILLILTICTGYCQIEPMPPFELFSPDYQTYRLEKERYSFNIINYIFQDGGKNIWLSTTHALNHTNGYQYFNVNQVLEEDNQLKGYVIGGQQWNDSTQYLIEQITNESRSSHALISSPPISLVELDSIKSPKEKLLFYDVIYNGDADERSYYRERKFN